MMNHSDQEETLSKHSQAIVRLQKEIQNQNQKFVDMQNKHIEKAGIVGTLVAGLLENIDSMQGSLLKVLNVMKKLMSEGDRMHDECHEGKLYAVSLLFSLQDSRAWSYHSASFNREILYSPAFVDNTAFNICSSNYISYFVDLQKLKVMNSNISHDMESIKKEHEHISKELKNNVLYDLQQKEFIEDVMKISTLTNELKIGLAEKHKASENVICVTRLLNFALLTNSACGCICIISLVPWGFCTLYYGFNVTKVIMVNLKNIARDLIVLEIWLKLTILKTRIEAENRGWTMAMSSVRVQVSACALFTNHFRKKPLRVVSMSSVPPSQPFEIAVKASITTSNRLGDCPFCQRVLLTLEEKHLPYDPKLVDLSNKPEWFLKINPDGKVPVIKFDEKWVPDSDVITQTLEEKYPSPALVTPPEKATVGSKIFSTFIGFLKSKDPKDGTEQALLSELSSFDDYIKENGPFINGNEISAADLSLGPKLYHMEIALGHYKKWAVPDSLASLKSYMKAIFSRESFVKTISQPQDVIEGWRPKVEG
ncbi:hypothetical protein VNO78_28160 [Psophocarpus tetragonolobus]|uniref:GST N-terminal domain-containing protein n=1 Tax=Psophocarpus tetragonolobus TaxID=3891 RepID=A0AAN9S4D1_PSOTE